MSTEHEATARPWKHGLLDTDAGSWLKLHKHGEMPVIRKGKKTIAVFVGDNPAADARTVHTAVNAHATMLAALKIAFNADMQDGDLRSSKTYYWNENTEPMTAIEVVTAAIAAGGGAT